MMSSLERFRIAMDQAIREAPTAAVAAQLREILAATPLPPGRAG